ncbi:MAG: ABC transporter substrate-binding protein [Sedimenticola sp.]|nr:ABC transporter substrate-binding protein [Sedimenticola sp.]
MPALINKSVRVLSLICLIFSTLTASAEQITFKLSHDEYKPFHWYDQASGKTVGLFVDLTDEVLVNRLGWKVVYSEYSWARAQQEVRTGTEDAYISTPTPERRSYTTSTKTPLLMMDKTIFTYNGHPQLEAMHKIKSLSELKPYALIDYLGNGWTEKNLVKENGLDVEFSGVFGTVLKKLALKRGDILVENPQLVFYNLKLLGLQDKVVKVPVTFDTAPFTFCISKKSPFAEKAELIDDAIKAMISDGTYERIIKKWQ